MRRGREPSRRNLYRQRKLAKEEGDKDDRNLSTSSSSDEDRGYPYRQKQPKLAEDAGDDGPGESDDDGADNDGDDDDEDEDEFQVDMEIASNASRSNSEADVASNEESIGDADELEQDSDFEEEEDDGSDEALPDVENDSLDSSEPSSSDESESAEDSNEEDSESEEDEEQEINQADNGDSPLYPNARITVVESLVMMLTLSLRFSLTGECMAQILELLEMHCPIGNLCRTSLFRFKNYFVELGRKALKFHYFCEHCMRPLQGGKGSVCRRCGDNTIEAFFIEIPFIAQLQKLFLREGFVESLMYRFNRIKKNPANYEDLYDGALYREQMENGFLSSRNNISFTWYSDGVQVFKSSKYAVWPLFLCINELSYKLRTQKNNILFCGLWFGKSKPKPNLFLKPFQETFETFKNVGYRLHVPNGGSLLVKAILLCGTCDLQAKSLFLKTKLYSGYYGCSKCYSKGVREAAGRTTVHVHPYTAPRNIKIRKKNDVAKCAMVARRRGISSYLGVKGMSLLYVMMPDMIRGTGIDVMHMVFIGVCKLLSKFWFNPGFSDEPFSCSAMLDIINDRLSSIYPPSFVQRMTRTLSDLKLWKAKEFKLFFFYYSIPVLTGILPRQYLLHHMKLVSAISFLCQDSIFPDQVDRAAHLLDEYVCDFQRLYGVRFMGMNVHLLTHLADAVKDLGPLWTMSCFVYEDLNGQLVKLIHAPYLPGVQISAGASLFMSLRLQIERLNPNSIAKAFCLKLNQICAKYKLAERIDDKTSVVGKKAFQLNVPLEIINLVRLQLQIENGHFMSFSTLRKRGVFFNSTDRPLKSKRCSQYACFDNDGVPILGQIKYFLRCSECDCVDRCACLPAKFLCVVKVYERTVWLAHEVQNVSFFHLFAVTPTDQYLVLLCDQIKCVCFYMNIGNVEYVATPVNSLEYE